MTSEGQIPAWVAQEIGRLHLELMAAQERILQLEKEREQKPPQSPGE